MDDEINNGDAQGRLPRVVKCPADLQRIRLERLMKNPEKPVIIPERPKERSMPIAPDFVRNVMGSSAGAGSGEFHVYRHLRRKEIARQKFIHEKSKRETLDEEYHRRIEENKKMAEEKTAKKRAKRLKKKEKAKAKGKKPKVEKKEEDKEESDDESSDEETEDLTKKESSEEKNTNEPDENIKEHTSQSPKSDKKDDSESAELENKNGSNDDKNGRIPPSEES